MYVYLYSDPKTFEPFYIGKGQGRRAHVHLNKCLSGHSSFYTKLRKMLGEGIEPLIEKIPVSSEWFANHLERGLIKLVGRKDLGLGLLTNLTDGGEGCSGMTSEGRLRISSALKGNTFRRGKTQVSWNKGLTKDTHEGIAKGSDKISIFAKTRVGTKNPNFGKQHIFSEHSCENMSRAHIGLKWITNGTIETTIKETNPPDGFVFGRLNRNK